MTQDELEKKKKKVEACSPLLTRDIDRSNHTQRTRCCAYTLLRNLDTAEFDAGEGRIFLLVWVGGSGKRASVVQYKGEGGG